MSFGDFVLFPRSDYIDGVFSQADVGRLDEALKKYMHEDPNGLQRTLDKMCGANPIEFYLGMASGLDQAVIYMGPEFESGKVVPAKVFRSKVAACWGTVLGAWAQMKRVESVFKEIL